MADAFDWYEARRRGLGHDFLRQLKTCLDSISLHPESYDPVYRAFRRALLRQFPYVVFFELADGTVTVFAVLHGSRDPKTWQSRLTNGSDST